MDKLKKVLDLIENIIYKKHYRIFKVEAILLLKKKTDNLKI